MEKFITLRNQNDFLQYLHSTFKNSFIGDDAETIPENSCSYNDTFKAFRINDASTTKKGSLQIYVGKLAVGDKIDVSLEVMNISGTKAKLAIDYVPAPYSEGVLQALLILQSEKNGEFEKLGGSFVSTQDGYVSVVLGTFMEDIGDFYIRNVNLKITTKNSKGSTDIIEGNWIPTFEGSTNAGNHTYYIRTGRYYKIGKLVHLTGRLDLTSKDNNISGFLRIGGLPFKPLADFREAGSVGYQQNLGDTSLHISTVGSTNFLRIGTPNNLDAQVSILQNNSGLSFSISYLTDE